MYEQFYNLSTHLGIQDLHTPKSVSGIIDLPAPTCSTITSYFAEHENILAEEGFIKQTDYSDYYDEEGSEKEVSLPEITTVDIDTSEI